MKYLLFTLILLFCCSNLTSQVIYKIVNPEGNILHPYPVSKGTLGSQDSTYLYAYADLVNDSIKIDFNGDGILGTFYDGCESFKNDLNGKIAIIEEGECPTYFKAFNAQEAGAVAALICADSFHVTNEPNLGLNGEGSDINIPVFSVSKAYCFDFLGTHYCPELPIIFEIYQKDSVETCENHYPTNVFWGDQPGQGDFSLPFEESGWTSINKTMHQDMFIWHRLFHNTPEYPRFFGADQRLISPTSNCGTASFSSILGLVYETTPTSEPPYTTFKSDLISPLIDCSGIQHVALDYYQLYNRLNKGSMISFSNDDGMTWSNPEPIPTKNILQSELKTERIILPVPEFANKPNCRIKFIGEDDAYYLMIDDVVLKDTIMEQFKFLAWYEPPMYQYSGSLPPVMNFAVKGKNDSNSILDSFSILVSVYDTLGSLLHQQASEHVVLNFKEDFEVLYPSTFIPYEQAGKLTIKYQAYNKEKLLSEVSYNIYVKDEFLSQSKFKEDYLYYRINDDLKTSGNCFQYKHYDLIPNEKINVKGVKFETLVSDPDINYTLAAYLFEWIDENQNDVIEPNERKPLIEKTLQVKGDFNDLVPFANDEINEFVYTIKQDASLIYVIDVNFPDNLNVRTPTASIISKSQEGLNLEYSKMVSDRFNLNQYYDNFAKNDYKLNLNVANLTPTAWRNHIQKLHIEKQDLTSIVEVKKEKILFYPNPTNGLVHFPNREDRSILVFDMNAETKSIKSIINNTLNLTDLPTGVYLLFDQDSKEYLGRIYLYNN